MDTQDDIQNNRWWMRHHTFNRETGRFHFVTVDGRRHVTVGPETMGEVCMRVGSNGAAMPMGSLACFLAEAWIQNLERWEERNRGLPADAPADRPRPDIIVIEVATHNQKAM